MRLNRKLTVGLVSSAAVFSLAGGVLSAPAAAQVITVPGIGPINVPDIDFGSLDGLLGPGGNGGGNGNGGAVNSPNGVRSMAISVSNWSGKKYGPDLYSTGFAPSVKWSARDASGAEVKGSNCQIEISFPGTGFATYKNANCQGSVGLNSRVYKTAGKYQIRTVDRVSGASATKSFTIE
ncbi:MAG: hypothetical protein WBA05_04465 [Gordonia sp. (in: high G+C Gram-positive bacteria)]|uniref:hypothetical protein n=1 Tax=Gordonia sp. (in: high G+C Gram-positive bacteria) TaxID=84139 RepID=UPI003C73A335